MRCLLLLAVALSGCASAPGLEFGYAGSDAGYVAAQQAAATWNTACGAELVAVHLGDGDLMVVEDPSFRDARTLFRDRFFLEARKVSRIEVEPQGREAALLVSAFGSALGLTQAETSAIDDEAKAGHPLGALVHPEHCAKVL